MKFDLLFRRRWGLVYVPILLIASALLWYSFVVWLPQPPHHITIAASADDDSTTHLIPQYRRRFSEMGIDVSVVTHAQADMALQAVTQSPARADLTLASGLLSRQASAANPAKNQAQAMALAVIEREPLWIFTRVPLMTKIKELRGMRIGMLSNDPTAQSMAALLFEQAQLKSSDFQLINLPSAQLANQLVDGNIDVAIVLASANNESVRLLMRSPYIQILGVDQIRQVINREPRLKPFVLPQGVIEIRGDIPPKDITLVAADLQWVSRPDLHPALQRALLDVATQLHERPNFLQRQGEFPRVTDTDFPASAVTLAAVRGNKPWLEQLLPYGWAQLVQWLLLACLPILVLTALLLAWIPSWFDWRVNAVLQNFYGELKFLETEIEPVASERPIEMKRLLQRLDDIEMNVMQLELPDPYSERWYTLRSHLAGAREHLLGLRAR